MKGANWLKFVCHQGRSLVNIFSLWNIWYKTVVLSLIWLHSLVCQIHNKQMSQPVAYSGNICVWVVSCNECGGWHLGQCSASIKKAMAPRATFMNFSWSYLQPLLTSCTCIFTIGCCVIVFGLLFFSYSLPCWELLSLHCQVLSRGESTPHSSALVQYTLKVALKPEGYITLIMWPPQPEHKLNHPYNLACTGKILLPLLLTRFGLE